MRDEQHQQQVLKKNKFFKKPAGMPYQPTGFFTTGVCGVVMMPNCAFENSPKIPPPLPTTSDGDTPSKIHLLTNDACGIISGMDQCHHMNVIFQLQSNQYWKTTLKASVKGLQKHSIETFQISLGWVNRPVWRYWAVWRPEWPNRKKCLTHSFFPHLKPAATCPGLITRPGFPGHVLVFEP